ncbi:MAG: hypothetical protein WCJ72_02495 [Chryseobacterium sp.]
MIDINTLRERITEVKLEVPEINSTLFVADDDELTTAMLDHKSADNILLMVVLPSYDGFGKEDESGIRTFLQFFILEKVDSKVFKNQDQYVDVFQKTLLVARKFVSILFGIKSNNCLPFDLDYNSLKMYPVSRKSQCNGWVIEMDDEKYQDF